MELCSINAPAELESGRNRFDGLRAVFSLLTKYVVGPLYMDASLRQDHSVPEYRGHPPMIHCKLVASQHARNFKNSKGRQMYASAAILSCPSCLYFPRGHSIFFVMLQCAGSNKEWRLVAYSVFEAHSACEWHRIFLNEK